MASTYRLKRVRISISPCRAEEPMESWPTISRPPGEAGADQPWRPSSTGGSGWSFDSRRKFARIGVVRCIVPSATIRRVSPLMRQIGVTRVGELTHLDLCRLPNFVAVRPREPGCGISYYHGKGLTRSQ